MDIDRPDPPRNPSDDSDARRRHLGDWNQRRSFTIDYSRTSYLSSMTKLTTLSLLLDDVGKEPESILKRIAELQPEIDHNVAQIKSAVDVVCPDALSSSDQANDQQLKQFKIYRLLKLKKMLSDFIQLRTCPVFTAASEHIKLMELSTASLRENRREACHYRVVIEHALDSIRLTINHLKGSEWDVAEDCRRYAVLAINSELDYIISNVNPLLELMKFTSSQDGKLSDPLIHHAQLVVPIFKLSKLFFKKSSRTRVNKKLVSPFTDMNSIQLSGLCQSARAVPGALKGILSLLCSGHGLPTDAATYENVIRFAETMASLMETQVQLTVTYLVPLVPQTGVLLDQNYYKDWFSLWDAQFTLAINNLIQYIKTI
ncbi:hypothetical protein PSTG_10227 [Puccinia striiformis f. sp. tritici PST-78]|uniref:Uncharacterized protein n=2 Tax=Puccinia striiformis f. sp. tritici TaxID=168172 RepID=A0A0L0VBG1_9BASI|nr:hypothetical protein PSTG_10227 [Puccinia striiformis f. sp. tritici PST-78]